MWIDYLTILTAAEAPRIVTDSSPIIVALISALSGVVVAAIGAVVALARRGSDQTTASPPGPGATADPKLPERVAVLEDWRKTIQPADAIHDKRLDKVEHRTEGVAGGLEEIRHALDRHLPGWRS